MYISQIFDNELIFRIQIYPRTKKINNYFKPTVVTNTELKKKHLKNDTLSSSAANQGDNTVSLAQGGTATPVYINNVYINNVYIT